MRPDNKQPRDAANLGDAQHAPSENAPGLKRRTREGGSDESERMDHVEIRENVPGERNDLDPEDDQGFTGPPGSGLPPARRAERIPHQRETAEMSPDDFDT
jgi:hypothetical protein